MKKKFLAFFDGVGSVFGLFPSKINNPYEKSDDATKLIQDWNVVGRDLEKSFHLAFSGKKHGLEQKRIKNH